MQLETYISDLLYRYDCVTVPEFGAFLTQRKSATVHDSTNAFYPPKKVLSFSESNFFNYDFANSGLMACFKPKNVSKEDRNFGFCR